MKSIVKIILCGIAIAWMYSATAEEEGAGQISAGAGADANVPAADANVAAPAAAEDVTVPTPPAPRIAVAPHRENVDRTQVEKRLEDRSARTKKRTAEAEKDVAERAGKAQQNQTNTAPQ